MEKNRHISLNYTFPKRLYCICDSTEKIVIKVNSQNEVHAARNFTFQKNQVKKVVKLKHSHFNSVTYLSAVLVSTCILVHKRLTLFPRFTKSDV
jgi:hypothetical protein